MKTKTFLIGLVGFFMLNSMTCQKDEIPRLPDETQKGHNTFGCLVNGELVIAERYEFWGYNQQEVRAYYDTATNQFRLEALTELLHRVEFFVSNPKVGQNIIDSVFFRTDLHYYVARNVQHIRFTRFDNYKFDDYFIRYGDEVASGTFMFDADCYDKYTHELIPNRKIQVRKGRFDVKVETH